jgi:hypothetical protein
VTLSGSATMPADSEADSDGDSEYSVMWAGHGAGSGRGTVTGPRRALAASVSLPTEWAHLTGNLKFHWGGLHGGPPAGPPGARGTATECRTVTVTVTL